MPTPAASATGSSPMSERRVARTSPWLSLVALATVVTPSLSGCFTYYLRGHDPGSVTRNITTQPPIDDADGWTVFGATADSSPRRLARPFFPDEKDLHLLECSGRPITDAALSPPSPQKRVPESVEGYVARVLPELRKQDATLTIGCSLQISGTITTFKIKGVGGLPSYQDHGLGVSPREPELLNARPAVVAFTAILSAPSRDVDLYRSPSRPASTLLTVGGVTLLLIAPVVAFTRGSSDGTNQQQHPGAGAVVGVVGSAMLAAGLYGLSASHHAKQVP